MAVKVTRRASNDGLKYSISGLTFSQLFRIKHAMSHEEERMKEIADQCKKKRDLAMARRFLEYAKETHEVFIAAGDGCV